MFPEFLECGRRGTGARSLRLLLCEQRNSPVKPDAADIIRRCKIGIGTVMQQEGAVAADAGGNHLAGFRMGAHVPRQRQERYGAFAVDAVRRPSLGQARAPGLLAFAALHIGAEAAGAQRDLLAGEGVRAEHLVAVQSCFGIATFRSVFAKLARVAAFGIVGAADEGAVAAKLQRQPARPASRAEAGIAAILTRREKQGRKLLVERFQHVGDAQALYVVDRAGELGPEVAQNVLPGKLAVRNLVQLFLKVGREVILHITSEEILQERSNDATLGLRHETALFDGYIIAVFERLQDCGVGGGSADAKLLQLLDERCLRVTRRRLRRMLRYIDRPTGERLAGIDLGKASVFTVFAVVLLHLRVGCEETVEADHRADGPEHSLAVGPGSLDLHRGALDLGGRHLAGDGALPDHLVEARLVRIEIFAHLVGCAREVGRTDGLMRFLSVLRLARIVARLVR